MKKHLRNRGFELPASFLVMLIFAIAVFGLGIYFLGTVITTTERIPDIIDEQSKASLEKLFQTGEQVAIPLNRKEEAIGKNAVFWLGLQNIFDTPKQLTVTVAFQSALNADGETLAADAALVNRQWVAYLQGPYTIQPRKYETVKILIKPQATSGAGRTEPGSYVFNVCITEGQPLPDCASPPPLLPSSVYGRKIYKIVVKVV